MDTSLAKHQRGIHAQIGEAELPARGGPDGFALGVPERHLEECLAGLALVIDLYCRIEDIAGPVHMMKTRYTALVVVETSKKGRFSCAWRLR